MILSVHHPAKGAGGTVTVALSLLLTLDTQVKSIDSLQIISQNYDKLIIGSVSIITNLINHSDCSIKSFITAWGKELLSKDRYPNYSILQKVSMFFFCFCFL